MNETYNKIHNAIKNSQFCVIPNCSHQVFEDKPEIISQNIT